jgi:hypothetical protein
LRQSETSAKNSQHTNHCYFRWGDVEDRRQSFHCQGTGRSGNPSKAIRNERPSKVGGGGAQWLERLSADERRALAKLASAGHDGATQSLLTLYGLHPSAVAELVGRGLASITQEKVRSAGGLVEVATIRITEAGRDALTMEGSTASGEAPGTWSLMPVRVERNAPIPARGPEI